MAESFHLVARNPTEMQTSQANLATWFRGKIELVALEASELSEALAVAKRNKWSTKTLASQTSRAMQRKMFYEKCLAAIDAGFTIIPNIPVDIFAIRVKRDKPLPNMQETRRENPSSWDTPTVPDQKPQILSVGDGNYQSPDQLMVRRGKTEDVDNGKKVIVQTVWATEFREIEFPVIAAAPSVMSATQAAMAMRIFDEVGVSPQNQRKGDPLIIGHVLGPTNGYLGRKTLSFLIAWHLDVRTL